MLALAGCTGSPSATASPTQPSESEHVVQSPAPSARATPTGSLNVTWTLAPFSGDGPQTAFATQDGWAALGDGAAWWSADGSGWEPGTVGQITAAPPFGTLDEWGTPHPVAISRLGDAWYSVAAWIQLSDTVYPVVFKSADGRDWQHEPSTEYWGQFPTGLTSSGTHLIASSADFAPGGGKVVTSSDGKAWTEHVADNGTASIEGVFADADGIIAVGFHGGPVPVTAVVWHSSDGQSWSETALAGAPEYTVPLSITRGNDGRYVLLTSTSSAQTAPCSEIPCPPDTLGAWYSDDGETWHQADVPNVELQRQSPFESWVMPAASGFAAFATTLDGPAAWSSIDGKKWEVLALPDALSSTSFSTVAADGQTIVLFGSSDGGTEMVIGQVIAGPRT